MGTIAHNSRRSLLQDSSDESNFRIENTAELREIDISQLIYVERDFHVVGNNILTAMNISSLVSVGGSLAVSNNTNLTALELPNIQTVGTNFIVQDNADMSVLQAANLISVEGNLQISNTDVQLLSFVGLEYIQGDCVVQDNDMLLEIDFNNTESINGKH